MLQKQSRVFWKRLGWSSILGWLMQLAFSIRALADDNDDYTDDYDALPGRTDEQIDALIFNFDEVIESIALYASLMSVLVIILTLALALRLKRWAAYIGLAIASMIWFAFLEQTSTGLYWIGFDIGYSALVVTGFFLASLHTILSGVWIARDEKFGWIRPVLFLLSLLYWGGLAMSWPIIEGKNSAMFIAVSTLVTLSHFAAIPTLFATKSLTVNVSRNGLVFIVIGLITMVAFIVFGEIAEDMDVVFLGRLVLISVVAFFSVFLVRHALMLLRDRDTRIQKSLEDARHDAEQSRALLESEQKYSRARDLAQRHTLRLATASHDIRQPIVSLRSTMAAVAKDQPQEVRDHLKAALDYLDQLAESYIDTEGPDSVAGDQDAVVPERSEIVSSDMICATLERMFRKEAEMKNLSFEITSEAADLKVEPLAVMRILSNLLSNGIKHTPDGQVALRAKPLGADFQFSVFNSANLPQNVNGDTLFDPFVKGDDSTGTGLGLSIVDTLSNRYGMSLSWSSPTGEGTTFHLKVPRE